MRLLDLFVFKYNRTDFHELNLDWIISDMRTLAETLENFISLNTIKYADPIQWNITRQYGANTVVIDANDGTAYLSVQPVPSGVAITNTDYWTPIFTLNLLSANQNITLRDDGSNVLATFASNTDDWLIWNATLYRVLQPIAVNEAYVVGYNLTRYTVEEFISDYIAAINTTIGQLTDLNTTDKASIVNAINETVDNTGDLSNLNTTDKSSIVNAVNEVIDNIGDLSDLDTTDKSSVVNAINDSLSLQYKLTPDKYGAVGDGITDDTAAFQNAANNSQFIYLPEGKIYKISSVTLPKGHILFGPGTIKFYDATMTDGLILSGDNKIDGITITDDYTSYSISESAIYGNEVSNIKITNVKFTDVHFGYVIRIDKSEYLDITFNNINGYSYAGIMLINGCEHATIEHNTIYDGRSSYANRYPISISGYFTTADRAANYIKCNYNTITDLTAVWEGIDSHSVMNAEIIGNVITGTSRGIVITNPSSAPALPEMAYNLKIANNIVNTTTDSSGIANGVVISNVDSKNIEVSNNVITIANNTSFHTSIVAGISFRQGTHSNILIKNNKVSNSASGISISNANKVMIDGNELYNMATANDHAISLIEGTADMTDVIIINNYIHDVVRSVRGSSYAAIVDYHNNVDNGVYETADYLTVTKSALNASMKALERKGVIVPSSASGVAFWLCRGANDWLSVAGTSV